MVLETKHVDMGPLQRGREISGVFGNPTGTERQKLEFGFCQRDGVLRGRYAVRKETETSRPITWKDVPLSFSTKSQRLKS